MAEHLQPFANGRGFDSMPEVEGANGEIVQVRESSAAGGPHLWLDLDALVEPKDDQGNVTGAPQWTGLTAHLTAEAAWQLAEQLMFLVKEHYQGDARPTVDRRAADFVKNKP